MELIESGNFMMNYHKLMALYNEKVLCKNSEVSFGNAMSIMKKKGIISPPDNPSIVTFVADAASNFLRTRGRQLKSFSQN